jgi:lexA repressor
MSRIDTKLLKQLRKSKSMTQDAVAKQLNIGRTAYTKIENGVQEIDTDALAKLAELFAVSIDYLLGADSVSKPQGVKIPVLGRVVAGIPIEAVTEIIDYEEIPASMAASGEYFALRVQGESMSPRIKEGDVVIVRKQETVENGEVAIVLVNGNEATIKEVHFSQFGVTLVAWNPSVYTPHFYPMDEVESLPLRILGKVIELRGKF